MICYSIAESMTKWEILDKFKTQKSNFKDEEIIQILLQNRGIKTKKEQDEFLNPKLSEITIKSVGISSSNLQKSVKRINQAIEEKAANCDFW